MYAIQLNDIAELRRNLAHEKNKFIATERNNDKLTNENFEIKARMRRITDTSVGLQR